VGNELSPVLDEVCEKPELGWRESEVGPFQLDAMLVELDRQLAMPEPALALGAPSPSTA